MPAFFREIWCNNYKIYSWNSSNSWLKIIPSYCLTLLCLFFIFLMFCFAGIGLFWLMKPIKAVETWAKQFLLCLTVSTSHSFDGIHHGSFGYLSFSLFHVAFFLFDIFALKSQMVQGKDKQLYAFKTCWNVDFWRNIMVSLDICWRFPSDVLLLSFDYTV